MHLTKQQFELAIPILVQKDLTQVKCPWSSKAHYYKHTTTSTSGIITNTTTTTEDSGGLGKTPPTRPQEEDLGALKIQKIWGLKKVAPDSIFDCEKRCLVAQAPTVGFGGQALGRLERQNH